MARQKFSLKKFNRDRERSLERSKQGELNLIAPKKIDTVCGAIVERHRKENHSLFQIAESCKHKRALGCDQPYSKREKPECGACL